MDKTFKQKLEILPIKNIQHPVGNTKYYAAVHVKTLIAQADEEIADLKSQLQQKVLPVVPDCVAKFIESYKDRRTIYGVFDKISKNRKTYPKLYEWVFEDENSQATFALAFITGKYQVEKPQLFYLKAKELLVVGDYDHVEDLWLDWNKNFTPKKQDAHKFTQQEIDSMQTGSYEQIEVVE